MTTRENRTVLIVDDSPDDRAEVRRLLLQGAERHVRFVEAETGRQAQQALDRLAATATRPDVILLDFHLPDADAPELLETTLRGAMSLPVCPVVVLTGRLDVTAGPEVLRAGAQDFVSKQDLTAHVLARAVENAIERFRLSVALAENEERLRLTLEAASTGLWEWDITAGRVRWSPECYQIHGLQPGDFGGSADDFDHLVHPDDREALWRAVLDAASHRTPFKRDFRVVWPNGNVRWVQNLARVIGPPGDPLRMIGTIVDITERKEAEEAVRESEAQLRQAMDAAGAGSWTLNVSTGAFTASARALELHGLAAGTPLTHERALACVHPDDRATVDDAIRRTVETGDPFRLELRAPLPDGSIRWVASHAERRSDDGQLRVVGLVQDITDRKRAAEALRASEERQAFLLALSDTLGALADPAEVQGTACRLLADFLHVSRAYYLDVDEAAGVARVTQDFVREHATPSLAGEHRLADVAWFVDMLRRGDCYAVEDTQTSPLVPAADRSASAAFHVIACCGAPVIRDRRLLAALCVADACPREWRDHEIALVREVSERLWARIEASHAQDALRERIRQLDLLAQTSQALLRVKHVAPSVVHAIGANIATLVDMESFYHYRPAEEPRRLRLTAHGGLTADEQRDFATIHFGELLCGRVAEAQQRVVVEDLQHAPVTGLDVDVLRAGGVTSYAGFPIVADGVLFGTLAFVSRRRTHVREGAVQLIQTVCELLAIAFARAQLEDEMRESEQRFRTMADQTPLLMWVTDAAGGVEFVNQAYCDFFGVTVDQVRGPGWQPLVHPEDQAYVTTFMDAVSARATFFASARVRRADGEWRWIASFARPRIAPDGTFVGMVGISPDVTDQHRASEREQEAARQKDEFIAVLAHELRNPLAPIRTSVGLLHALGAAEPTLAKCRDVIDRQVTHMARLLDDLLDVSRLSRGTLTLQPATVRLQDVVTHAVETVRPIIDDREHTLVLEPIDPSVVLDADPARLAQVFTNLLNNAAKYTDARGRITVSADVSDQQVVLRVKDTGIGLQPVLRDRIFDLFTQVEDARHRSDGGLGIGLGLTRRLVEMHGGTITAESPGPGQGTTFTVTLPMRAGLNPKESAGPPAPGEFHVQDARRRVLIVDDNVDAADTLALLLDTIGCETRTAYDGEAALHDATTFRPDLILLDLGLPGLDGAAVCTRLRQEPWGSSVVIAAITGWGQEEDRRRTKISGFDAHLVKPVEPQQVLALVRELPSHRLM